MDDATSAQLEVQIRAYDEKRAALVKEVDGLLPDPADAVSDLLSWSEEFGREHAIELFQNDLHTYPADPRVLEAWDERAVRVSRCVDELLDIQDRLDSLTAARDAARGRELVSSERAINIQGRNFELEGRRAVLRDEHGQEHEIGREPELSLTQTLVRDVEIESLQPERSGHTSSRSRGR